jgi:hypothetical protein
MQPLLKSLKKKKKKKHLLFHRFVNRLGKNKLPEKITSIIVGINSNRRRLQEKKTLIYEKAMSSDRRFFGRSFLVQVQTFDHVDFRPRRAS